MTQTPIPTFAALGQRVTQPSRQLETFPAPAQMQSVSFDTDELTAFCPVTAQPDFYTLHLAYAPDQACLESKSLKLYVWSFRNEQMFAEALASQIAQDVMAACQPFSVTVTLRQSRRGGLELTATAHITRNPAAEI